MNFFSILTLLGGLAMFLYGMQVMGDGLAKVSGGLRTLHPVNGKQFFWACV